MKDLKKLLKEHRSDILPDDEVRERIRRELCPQDAERVPVPVQGVSAAEGRKKSVIIAACIALALILSICLILIPLVKRPKLPGNTTGDKFAQITDADSFYAYGAVSVGALLSSAPSEASGASVSLSFFGGIAENSPAPVSASAPSEEELQTINRYMALVESLLSEGSIESSAAEGKYGYAYGMTVRFADLLGNNTEYYLFYNRESIGNRQGEEEDEDHYSIVGLLEIGGSQYPVEGRYETENDEDESESELWFRAFTNEDRSSFIEVKQENESESEEESEIEYVYTVYMDGRATERTVVEYEREDDELELKMTIEQDGKREMLLFEDETENGERVINVRGDLNGEQVSFRIYVREEGYHYVFDDGSSSDFERYDEDDDD